jgi:hypothetical protein
MKELLEEIVSYEMNISVEVLRKIKKLTPENYINMLKEYEYE